MKFKTLLWAVLAILILTACSSGADASPTPTPFTLTVDVTPSAQPVVPALNQCAAEIDGLSLMIEQRYPEFFSGDLLIRLGEPATLSSFAAQIGQEELVVALNPANPVGSLTQAEIQALFSGQVSGWAALGGADVGVNVWVPLSGDETRTAFDEQIMEGLPLVSTAKLAPEADAMQQAITADPYAIGLLARATLAENTSLRVILPGVRFPILILAETEPQGLTAELVTCLQTGAGQESLSEIYP